MIDFKPGRCIAGDQSKYSGECEKAVMMGGSVHSHPSESNIALLSWCDGVTEICTSLSLVTLL